MIPCLYASTETEFHTNGIGKLSDCVSCIVTEKRNGSFELAMKYPSDGLHAESLTEGNLVLAGPSESAAAQPFRIYQVTTSLTGLLEIAARHISYQLNYITVSPCSVVSGSSNQVELALSALKENASTACPFSFETDKSSADYFGILEPMSLRSALGGVEGSVLDTFGGEFEWDFYTVRLHKSRGSDNGVRIVYGKNLVDFKQEKNNESVITGVHPYWKDSDTGDITELSEKVVTLDTDTPYEKIGLLDCSEYFEEQPTEEQLRAYAADYLESTTLTEPSIDIDIDFAQLWQFPGYADIAAAERVALCDTVHVYITKLGIEVSATVTETVYDSLLERYNRITLSNSVTSSRNSSLALTVATTSQVKSLLAMTDSAIRLTVANTYATKATLENNYSTTVQTKALIEASADAVTLAYTKKLTDEYSTTSQIEAMISLSEDNLELSVTDALADYTKSDAIRSAFAMDSTSITVSSGVIAFNSNSISISSSNFTLTSSGTVTARGTFTAGSDSTYKMTMTSGALVGYYANSEIGRIYVLPEKDWTMWPDSSDLTTYEEYTFNALCLKSGNVDVKSTVLSLAADYLMINYSDNDYYTGSTGSLRVVTDIEWTDLTMLKDITITFSSSSVSKSYHTFSALSHVQYQTIKFHKGLMITTLD